MIVKIAHDKEIHLYRGEANFTKLKKHCQNIFKSMPKSFEFFYYDSDGDKITVNSQQDLEIVFENQCKSVIKKLYIQETESEFEVLSEKGNPEEYDVAATEFYCPLPIYSSEIRVTNIVKERLSKKQEELIHRQSKNFLLDLENQLITKMLEQQRRATQEAVSQFLQNSLQKAVIDKVMEQEQKIVKEEVARSMEKLMEKCADEIVKGDAMAGCRDMGVQNGEMSLGNLSRNQVMINRIVDERIRKMMPGLVKQISRAVQAKLAINGCLNCQRKAQMDLQMTMGSNLMKKCQNKYHEH